MSIAENISKGRVDIDRKLMTVDDAMYNLSANTANDSLCPCLNNKPKVTSKAAYEEIAVAVPVDGDLEGGSILVKGQVDDDIIRAAKESNAHDFIMKFTNQYDTYTGKKFYYFFNTFLIIISSTPF